MQELSAEQQARLTQHGTLLRNRLAADPTLASQATGIWLILQQSETKLMALLNNQQPPDSAPGYIELGPTLYLLHQLPPSLAWVTQVLIDLGMPPTQITAAEIQQWKTELAGPGVVASDGSLVADSTYAVFDPGWAYAVFEYMIYYLGIEQQAQFSTCPATFRPPGDSLTVALLGDWGTGVWDDGSQPACPSQMVMQNLQKASPDIAIHLGDVYYAGTEKGFLDLGPGEEATHFVNDWPTFPLSLTLNSNHEMYDGGHGYFKVALATNGPFSKQHGTSYFAIEFGNWVIFGLDTAYYDPSLLVMEGALVDPNQLGFIRSFNLVGKKVMVITHHNGLSVDGLKPTGLWSDLYKALGKRNPDYWYWGHVHNGVIYQQSATGTTLARCIGHAALPFGNAYGLHDPTGNPIPSVVYYAHTPLANPNLQQRNRVLNGYAVLTFTDDTVTETLFDQNGGVAWTSAVGSSTTPSGE